MYMKVEVATSNDPHFFTRIFAAQSKPETNGEYELDE